MQIDKELRFSSGDLSNQHECIQEMRGYLSDINSLLTRNAYDIRLFMAFGGSLKEKFDVVGKVTVSNATELRACGSSISKDEFETTIQFKERKVKELEEIDASLASLLSKTTVFYRAIYDSCVAISSQKRAFIDRLKGYKEHLLSNEYDFYMNDLDGTENLFALSTLSTEMNSIYSSEILEPDLLRGGLLGAYNADKEIFPVEVPLMIRSEWYDEFGGPKYNIYGDLKRKKRISVISRYRGEVSVDIQDARRFKEGYKNKEIQGKVVVRMKKVTADPGDVPGFCLDTRDCRIEEGAMRAYADFKRLTYFPVFVRLEYLREGAVIKIVDSSEFVNEGGMWGESGVWGRHVKAIAGKEYLKQKGHDYVGFSYAIECDGDLIPVVTICPKGLDECRLYYDNVMVLKFKAEGRKSPVFSKKRRPLMGTEYRRNGVLLKSSGNSYSLNRITCK